MKTKEVGRCGVWYTVKYDEEDSEIMERPMYVSQDEWGNKKLIFADTHRSVGAHLIGYFPSYKNGDRFDMRRENLVKYSHAKENIRRGKRVDDEHTKARKDEICLKIQTYAQLIPKNKLLEIDFGGHVRRCTIHRTHRMTVYTMEKWLKLLEETYNEIKNF